MSSPPSFGSSPPAWLGFTSNHSYPKHKIKVLLLENINPRAKQLFEAEGFQIETVAGTLPPEELKAKLADCHAVGLRSRTNLTSDILNSVANKKLLTAGCFCIGTNQVDLEAAKALGVPVFNSPFCNSRSVGKLSSFSSSFPSSALFFFLSPSPNLLFLFLFLLSSNFSPLWPSSFLPSPPSTSSFSRVPLYSRVHCHRLCLLLLPFHLLPLTSHLSIITHLPSFS
jgi:hypothetical protein